MNVAAFSCPGERNEPGTKNQIVYPHGGNHRVIVRVFEDKLSLSKAAAEQASAAVCRAILDRGCARIVVATGASQLDFLDALTNAENIDWQRVEMFHLDEYVGLPITHPASFRKYLLERLIHKTGITQYHLLDGNGDPGEVVRRVGVALRSAPVDVVFAGIGEKRPSGVQRSTGGFPNGRRLSCRQPR